MHLYLDVISYGEEQKQLWLMGNSGYLNERTPIVETELPVKTQSVLKFFC